MSRKRNRVAAIFFFFFFKYAQIQHCICKGVGGSQRSMKSLLHIRITNRSQTDQYAIGGVNSIYSDSY